MSAFLQRDTLISLPASQRQLITLVLRKLLASSTFAIAGTLQGLVGRLRNLKRVVAIQQAQAQAKPAEASTPPASELIDESDFESILELEDEWEPDEEPVADEPTVQAEVTTRGSATVSRHRPEIVGGRTSRTPWVLPTCQPDHGECQRRSTSSRTRHRLPTCRSTWGSEKSRHLHRVTSHAAVSSRSSVAAWL